MTFIKIELPALDAMKELTNRLEHREPLMREIAGILHDEVEENFAQEGRPKWLGIQRDGKILQDSGRLAASVTPYSDNDTAAAGSNVVYAAIHHFGGQTRPHVIRPRHKKALRFNGRFAKIVNHPGSKIPARPIFVASDEGMTDIENATVNYLAK